MAVVTNTPLTMAYAIPDIADVLSAFTRLRAWRSRDGELGLYEPATAPSAGVASVLGSLLEPHALNGKTLTIKINGTTTVDVAFAGADPYSSTAAATEIDAASALITATNEGGRVRISTVATGSGASLELSGDAAPYLGFESGTAAVGLDADLVLVGGTYQYFYTDQNSSSEFYYRFQYINHSTLDTSELSVPVQGDPYQVVNYSLTSLGYVSFVDLQGRGIPKRKVTISTVFQPNAIGDNLLARHNSTVETDGRGYAEVRVLRGAVVDVSVDGTGIVRRITVPSTDVFNFFDPALVPHDEFGIAELNIPFAIRTS